MHKAFYGNITDFAHAQAVCTRPLLGGEGPGNEARSHNMQQTSWGMSFEEATQLVTLFKVQSFIDTAQVDTICSKTTDIYINLNPGMKNVLKFR